MTRTQKIILGLLVVFITLALAGCAKTQIPITENFTVCEDQ